MQNHIRRIKEIDRQVKQLNEMLRRGESIAAGLTIYLALGGNPDDDDFIRLEVSEFTIEILTLLTQSLQQSKYMRQVMLKSEYNEATDFINGLD